MSKKNINIYDLYLMEEDDFDQFLKENSEDVKSYNSFDFKESFIESLEKDLKSLEEIQKDWGKVFRDPKIDSFIDRIKKDDNLKEKSIIFTESKETGEYLYKKINEHFPGEVIFISSERGLTNDGQFSIKKARDMIVSDFDPRFEGENGKYRFLITTDVLAEGINLHRSNVVINYDLPWNPTRVLQRVGRINRVGTKHKKLFVYNFFPTESSENEIHLKASIEAKNRVDSIMTESSRKIEQLRQQEITSAELEVKRNQLEIQKEFFPNRQIIASCKK